MDFQGVQRSTSITFKPAPSVASANALSVATLVASTADDEVEGRKQTEENLAAQRETQPDGAQIVPVTSTSADLLSSPPPVSASLNTNLGESHLAIKLFFLLEEDTEQERLHNFL